MGAAILAKPARIMPPLLNGEALYEVINGQRVEKPVSTYASWIAKRLITRVDPFVEAGRLGNAVIETLLILDPEKDLRRRPDLAFISAERWPFERELPLEGDWAIVPDLAVEVLSPNDLYKDIMAKLHQYFKLGVRVVWLIDPEHREVHVYAGPSDHRTLTVRDELEGGEIIPGWRMPVAELFQRQGAATN